MVMCIDQHITCRLHAYWSITYNLKQYVSNISTGRRYVHWYNENRFIAERLP